MKRIYYYFEFKKLLKQKRLTQLVKWQLKRKYGRKSILRFCITNSPIRNWFDCVLYQHEVLQIARNFCGFHTFATVLTKHFNQARDKWIKTHKNI